jgi:hypothetical protein
MTFKNHLYPLPFVLLVIFNSLRWNCEALLFRVDQFTDLTDACKDREGKPINYILNEDNPALYVSIDPTHTIKSLNKRLRKVDQNKMFGSLADQRILQDLMENKQTWAVPPFNDTFDCVIQIETELPKGEKSGEKYDALSLIIIELNYSTHSSRNFVEISTIGHDGKSRKVITKKAHYSDRIWAATNPNFLLSGQLSGFDSIDYRTKVDAQHIIKPETLHSTFDKPASITVNVTRWTWTAQIYMVFTSYKYLRGGTQRCQDGKEFDCSPPSFLSSSNDHMCMSSNLACDGLPNCGQDYLPNQDENCFKIHWSSVLLSLVSYILLAITLLLCLSCFARVLIQWSVRSSLAELRGSGGGGGVASPTGSFRSSSRFFSFLGNTFSSRWERPPPTYDEAMKHVNPDIARPLEPPAYSDTFSGNAGGSGGAADGGGGGGSGSGASSAPSHAAAAIRLNRRSSLANDRGSGAGIVQTPPPEYDSQESQSHTYLEIGSPICLPPPPASAGLLSGDAPGATAATPSTLTSVINNTLAGGNKHRRSSRSAEALLSSASTSSSTSSSYQFARHHQPRLPKATRSTSSATVTATVEAEICPPSQQQQQQRQQDDSSSQSLLPQQ